MKKITDFICFLILVLFASSVRADSMRITKEKALQVANETAEVQAFLKLYGECKGCNPSYSVGKTALIGCTEYKIEDNSVKDEWVVEYWVSEACSFRYPSNSKSTRIKILINKTTSQVIAREPKLEYITDQRYCENDTDCLCRSGSGVPFLGCINFLHAPSAWAGSYKCEKCICLENVCSENKK